MQVKNILFPSHIWKQLRERHFLSYIAILDKIQVEVPRVLFKYLYHIIDPGQNAIMVKLSKVCESTNGSYGLVVTDQSQT